MKIDQPPPPGELARRRLNRGLFFLAAAATASGLSFFLDPTSLEQTAVGRAVPGIWDELWSGLYVVGGILTMTGAARQRGERAELLGLNLLLVALTANAVAIILTRGTAGLTQLPLYVLAGWVLFGRRDDLLALPRERRRIDTGPPPDGERRAERLAVVALPAVLAPLASIDPTSIIVAILSGGVFTAIANALLYNPQKGKLQADADLAVSTAADTMLKWERERLATAQEQLVEARRQLAAANVEIAALKEECSELRARLDRLDGGLPA